MLHYINYEFQDNNTFVEIKGDKKSNFLIEFYNNDKLTYSTNINENCWAKTNSISNEIRIYKDNNLIFHKLNNNDNFIMNDISINYMNDILVSKFFEKDDNILNPLAIIVPHASYIYSGEVCSKSFLTIDKNKKYENIFILSTSHKNQYKGVSLLTKNKYETPFGTLNINQELQNEFINNDEIFNKNDNNFLNDHTIDMILPFIQERIKFGYKIVPIMVGDNDINNLKKISEILKPYLNDNNLFIISTDFSHYLNYDKTNEIDNQTIDLIISNKLNNFINDSKLLNRMCGWSSYLILLNMIENNINIEIKKLSYINSGDIINDKNHVVGYSAICFFNKNKITDKDKEALLNLSRKTIHYKLINNEIYNPDDINLNFENYSGAFVSLYLNNSLKGCVGKFFTNYNISYLIRDISIESAFFDNRFNPITLEEYYNIDIEISILSNFKKIKNINEIKLGEHGIYIIKNDKSAIFLPQVIHQTNWNLIEYLGNCCYKAGLDWNEWNTCDIYIYNAIVFRENKSKKESLYYKILNNNMVECFLCPHGCKIKNNEYGICLSRKNENGILYSMGYGNLSWVSIDPIEKKPFSLFMQGTKTYSISTAGCNFKCLNCQNWTISQTNPEKMTLNKMLPLDIVNNALINNCPSISYTYTEPTIFYELMFDTAKLARENNLKNLMISNGYINENPLRKLCKYIDAFNIDIKSFSDKFYKEINKGTLEPVLNTLKIIKEFNIWLEITLLIIPNKNDNLTNLIKMFDWLLYNNFNETPIHILKVFPTYKMLDIENVNSEIIDHIKLLANKKGFNNIFI